MNRIALLASVFAVLLSMSAGAQEPARRASPGKYRFTGTVARNAEVSGWFEVDIHGVVWLTDRTPVQRDHERAARLSGR